MDPEYVTEKLSKEEVRALRIRMVVVWCIGVGVAVLCGYMLFGTFGGGLPLILFAVFFYSILVFILSVHTINAFRTEKRIYSGVVTDKRTEVSRMRSSSLNEEYFIALDGDWFRVDLSYFGQVQVGDRVKLHTFGNRQVFRVEKQYGGLNPAAETRAPVKHTDIYAIFPGFSERLTEGDRSVLKKSLRKAVFLRLILGGATAYVLLFVFNFIGVMISIGAGFSPLALVYIYYISWLLSILLFVAVNLKTLWLVRDLVRGEKEVVTETIADLVRSTHYKPGPNSIVQKGYYSNKDYFYIRTVHHWLPVDKALFDAARTGAPLHIHKGKRSKVILDLRL